MRVTLLELLRRKYNRAKVLRMVNRPWTGKDGAYRLLYLEYPVIPKERASSSAIRSKLIAGHRRYADNFRAWSPILPPLSRIEVRSNDSLQPAWGNEFLPPLDATAIYAFLTLRNPALYIEIGSGNSTKFARRAIRDHKLRTMIVSIDPHPRAEIDELCDSVIRKELQECDLAIFDDLRNDDVIFYDGSHRAFQNSDVTVFFCEVLPRLSAGVMIGVHDIFLPDDYPIVWMDRFYSEQYLLECYLLGGDALSIELPAHYCATEPDMRELLKEVWHPVLPDLVPYGGAFWVSTNELPH